MKLNTKIRHRLIFDSEINKYGSVEVILRTTLHPVGGSPVVHENEYFLWPASQLGNAAMFDTIKAMCQSHIIKNIRRGRIHE